MGSPPISHFLGPWRPKPLLLLNLPNMELAQVQRSRKSCWYIKMYIAEEMDQAQRSGIKDSSGPKAQIRMAAAEIDLGKLPFDIDFHPSDNLVAAGLITGDLLLNRYNTDSQAQKLLEVNVHSESCRTVRFINEGRDCSIPATDIETGSEIVRLENSHGAAVNLTESTIASGDDEGCIKMQVTEFLSSHFVENLTAISYW